MGEGEGRVLPTDYKMGYFTLAVAESRCNRTTISLCLVYHKAKEAYLDFQSAKSPSNIGLNGIACVVLNR